MDDFFSCLSPSFFSIFSVFIFLAFLRVSSAKDDVHFTSCAPFECGNIQNITYPFWTDDRGRPAYCGFHNEGYKLKCIQNMHPVITISSQEFQMLHLNESFGRMTIQRLEFGENTTCPQQIPIDAVFNYSDTAVNMTLSYGCREGRASAHYSLTCKELGKKAVALFFKNNENEPTCVRKIEVPVENKALEELKNGAVALSQTLVQPFDMKYFAYDDYCRKCGDSGGRCGLNTATPGLFACYCRDGPYDIECHAPIIVKDGSNWHIKLIIGLVGSAGTSLMIICICTICFKRKSLHLRTTGFLTSFPKIDQDIEAFLKINGTLAPKRYSYPDIRKMTNSFKEKLGKGGYGSVYKGKLCDGHLVAVKMLDTSKGNGQEFINEVASISRTSHVNVVTLLGFCLEGKNRALIYEFMSNGSLERFIYKENTNSKDRQHLKSEELYCIAIGIARGLEYLHRGCNTRIVHFDIKPHNILLDENFCPKISDFGLAKLCTRKESFVSMTEARGTIGYIAPEVFCRSVGGVSHKSDVYSYGMMILEMVGGRSNIRVAVSQTSEIYFPHWIYKHLEQGNIEPKLLGLMTIEETEIARKMILVGLWCIQTNPPDRPSISKVIEMLEGNIEALDIPPRPYLSSPVRTPVGST